MSARCQPVTGLKYRRHRPGPRLAPPSRSPRVTRAPAPPPPAPLPVTSVAAAVVTAATWRRLSGGGDGASGSFCGCGGATRLVPSEMVSTMVVYSSSPASSSSTSPDNVVTGRADWRHPLQPRRCYCVPRRGGGASRAHPTTSREVSYAEYARCERHHHRL